MARLCWRVCLVVIAASICSLQVNAGPIVYTFATTATGTLGGTPFTDALLVVTLAGDTSGITAGPPGFTQYQINPGSATLIIGGLGTATLTDPMVAASTYFSTLDGENAVLVADNAPGNGTGLVATTGSVFYGYNLGSLGPITGGGGIGNGGGPGNTFPTSAGILEFAAGQDNNGSVFTAVTTQTLTGYQGGTTSAPAYLVGGAQVGEVTGTISGLGAEDYYWFYWGGGAFAATASITDAASGASYLFSGGVAGTCNSVGNATLNSGDGFSAVISAGNLAAGQYCIGLDANSANDPNFSVIFDTPVSGVPEPGTFVLLSGGLAGIAIARRAARRRTR